MKQTSTYLLFVALLLSFVFASCDAGKLNKKAEETATAFYTALQKKDYKAALSSCSSHAFTTDGKDAWDCSFNRNAGLLGEIKSFTRTNGFNISTSTNLGTTVTMLYDVQWQYGKSKDSVVLVKEKDGSMKVSRYAWDFKDAKFLTEVSQSEKAADDYMQAVKAGDYKTATSFRSEAALQTTPKEQWVYFLQNAANVWGTVSDYRIAEDSSTYDIAAKGDAGNGNYYDVVVQSQRGDRKVMEKVVFFQKTYDDPIKLMGHKVL